MTGVDGTVGQGVKVGSAVLVGAGVAVAVGGGWTVAVGGSVGAGRVLVTVVVTVGLAAQALNINVVNRKIRMKWVVFIRINFVK